MIVFRRFLKASTGRPSIVPPLNDAFNDTHGHFR